jgi:hypothetical protein
MSWRLSRTPTNTSTAAAPGDGAGTPAAASAPIVGDPAIDARTIRICAA